MLSTIGFYIFFLATVLASASFLSADSEVGNAASAKPPDIVIGFLGGFVAHDNPIHSEVQLSARLRKEFPTGVEVQTFESYNGEKAHQAIRKLLDINHDGTLSEEEKQNARIIIYGHSWGGAESVYLARTLEKDGIPVLLTIQVDSICRPGANDTTIPANVAQAANFYQPHGLLHGHHDIRPANEAKTRIVGNFRFDYRKSSLNCPNYPWYDRRLVKSHTQIECDPVIWDQVDALIRSTLAPAKPGVTQAVP